MIESASPAVSGLVSELVADVRQVLGQQLAGLYLYGSLVTGDFDEQISDIDFLAATASGLDAATLERLRQMHEAFARRHPLWAGRIEVAYVPIRALKTFRTRRSRIAVISPGEPLHFKDAGKDWLLNWYMVQEQGITLYGPPPAAFIDPIPRRAFVRASAEHAQSWRARIEEWPARPGAQAYAVLTLCRALYTHAHGEQSSKLRAATWAAGAYPEWSALIEQALRWRSGQSADHGDGTAWWPDTVKFVHAAIDLIVQA